MTDSEEDSRLEVVVEIRQLTTVNARSRKTPRFFEERSIQMDTKVTLEVTSVDRYQQPELKLTLEGSVDQVDRMREAYAVFVAEIATAVSKLKRK